MAEKTRKIKNRIIDCLAAVITGHDLMQAYIDRGCYIIRYHFAKFIHNRRDEVIAHKKQILGYFAGCLLIAIGIVAMFNYATTYEYSYNGKALGYVKDQEQVLKILDLANRELTKEYGSEIHIDAEEDISFHRVLSFDRDVDTADAVLKKFTYMSDMETRAYGIYVDKKLIAVLQSEEKANDVLDTLKSEYTQKKAKTKYEKVSFKENVKIKKVTVKLGQIQGVSESIRRISTGAQKEIIYTVKAGDTYSGICSKNNITFAELKKNNPKIKANELYADQKLVITKAVSSLTVRTVEKSTFAEVIKYKTVYKKSSSLYKGDSTVTQAGKNGKQIVTARLTKENGDIVKKDVLESEIVTKAVTKIVTKGTKTRPKTAPTGSFMTPITSGYSLTSEYGWRWGRMHEGIDMACGTGTPIYAADGGTVTYAGWYSGYGKFIEISHGNGKVTRYGHCDSIDVSAGQAVYKGQKIGGVGNTGNSTGSHLHFEIKINGSTVNPLNYI